MEFANETPRSSPGSWEPTRSQHPALMQEEALFFLEATAEHPQELGSLSDPALLPQPQGSVPVLSVNSVLRSSQTREAACQYSPLP